VLFVQKEVQIFLCYSSSSPVAELHSHPHLMFLRKSVGYGGLANNIGGIEIAKL